ncbi:unnamed protein product, partial [Rotaria sp. Silwood2]
MGCQVCKKSTVNETTIKKTDYNGHLKKYQINDSTNDNTTEKPTIPINVTVDDDRIITRPTDTNDHIEIQIVDSQAFNESFIQQRQQAINNRSYQSTIESWRPKSLQQLTETIKTFSKGKSLIDHHWIIFYWIA